MDIRTKLEGYDKDQLIEYGNLTFDLGLKKTMSKGDLVDAIEPYLMRFKGNQETMAYHTEGELPKGYALISVTNPHSPSDQPVIVGVNGNLFSVPVGTDTPLPLEYVEALDNAVITERYKDPVKDEDVVRDKHSYPFTVKSMNR